MNLNVLVLKKILLKETYLSSIKNLIVNLKPDERAARPPSTTEDAMTDGVTDRISRPLHMRGDRYCVEQEHGLFTGTRDYRYLPSPTCSCIHSFAPCLEAGVGVTQ